MVKKLYICRECGYGFPSELSHLIENKIQVYCEMCGTPFSLAGIEFKQPKIQPQESRFKPYSREALKERSRKKFRKAIKTIDSLSYLPILIFSCLFITTNWIFANPNNLLNFILTNLLVSIAGFLLVIYDIKHMTPKVKQERYDEILLDAFCLGILGCIIYGTGVLLLIKGILIIIYSSIYLKSEKHKTYNFGLKLKDSINHFSGFAGFIILIYTIVFILNGVIDASYIYFGLSLLLERLGSINDIISFTIFGTAVFALILFPSIFLIIDIRKRANTREKKVLKFGDFISYFIIGVISTAIYSIGIFILLKSILIFLLFVGKPFDWEGEDKTTQVEYELKTIPEKVVKVQKELLDTPIKDESPQTEGEKEEDLPIKKEEKDKIIQKSLEKEEERSKQEITPEESPKEEIELRLHESLLPVKDEKDKKVVKRYLTKIFNVFSKDLKERIMELEIPKNDKEEIVNELLFLSKKEQLKYLEAIAHLYKEIPYMLIERIRKLPNVKPEHYDKIIDQLKYMDFDEQMEFVLFLEEYAK